MKKKYHFISGLPRSGSTLLTSILNQNPKFYSEISNPLAEFIMKIVETNSSGASNRVICSNDRLKNSIKHLVEGYNSHLDQEIIFNTNRGWTKITEYLNELNSDFKIICCVRDYVSILNSFEALYKKRGFYDMNPIYENNTLNVYSRTDFLAQDSFVRFSYNALREAYYGPHRKNLLLIEYEELVSEPKETMKRIYNFINEPYFNHNFNDVKYSYEEYDKVLGSRYLHNVKTEVKKQNTQNVLPPDLHEKYLNWEFWRND